MSQEQRVPGYENDPVQEKKRLVLETYEYIFPFNYPNIQVNRHQYHGSEPHGVELFPINTAADKLGQVPADSIVVHEDYPIVRVAVIGSACTPPGYVTVEAEPTEDFRRYDEIPEVMPVRFRISNLWGMHLRYDQWYNSRPDAGNPLPENFLEHSPGFEDGSLRCTSREMPLAGMSCAIFEIPRSGKVSISGGAEIPGWASDFAPDDNNYSFRIIRTTVAVEQE